MTLPLPAALLLAITLSTHARANPSQDTPAPARVPAVAVGMLSDELAWAIDGEGRARSIDARTGAIVATRALPAAFVAAAAGGGRLVVSVEGGRAVVLARRDLEEVGGFVAGEHVLVARDGERALTYGAGLAGSRVHALPSGELLRSIDIPKRRLARVAWDGRGEVVAVVDAAGRPHAWGVDGTLKLPLLTHITSCAVDPRGRWVAFGDEVEGGEDPTVYVLSARTAEVLARLTWESVGLEFHFPFGAAIRHLGFDPVGGHLVATTGDHGAILTWKATDSGWERGWLHDYGGGNPGSELHVAIDARAERLWVWGFDSAGFELPSGHRLVGFLDERRRSYGWSSFAPSPDGRTIPALHVDELVLLEPDGTLRFDPTR